MKIENLIIFFPIFNRGGLEEVSNLIVKYLKNSKINIYFITFKKNKYLFKNNKNIKILCPNNSNKKIYNLKRIILCCKILINLLRKNNQKNTIILSLQNSSFSILIAKFFRFKIIVKNATPINALFYLNNKFQAVLVFLMKIITYNLADRIIVNSISNKNSLSKFILGRKKISMIYNPTNLKENNFTIKKRKKIILSVGRLVYEKGIHILIKAFKELQRDDYKLILVGDGIYRKKLEELVISLNLQKRVKFKGWIKNPEKFYRSAQIFVLPSFFEGFGNVLVEAMNFNTPCISTLESGGPSEILGYGKYGLLASKNDVQDLKNKIDYSIKNSVKIKKKTYLAKKSLIRFKDNISIKKYIKELDNLLIA